MTAPVSLHEQILINPPKPRPKKKEKEKKKAVCVYLSVRLWELACAFMLQPPEGAMLCAGGRLEHRVFSALLEFHPPSLGCSREVGGTGLDQKDLLLLAV